MTIDTSAGRTPTRDPRLVELIVRARIARDQLMAMTDAPSHEAAAVRREYSRIARFSYLSPEIIAAIFAGQQPDALTARTLIRIGALPLDWSQRHALLGFA